MKNITDLTLSPEQYFVEKRFRQAVAEHLKTSADNISHIQVLRRSIDSRRAPAKYHITANVYLEGETFVKDNYHSDYKNVADATPVIIVGAGPAGLFAALRALELGFKPIIIEQGKDVSARKFDIAKLAREKVVNPVSNWCCGEGGAGTFSDGKLYTRSTKRGNIDDVLRKFVEHGVSEEILIDAHAHIGTDKLSDIIANIRHTIEEYGGEYIFETQIVDLKTNADNEVLGVVDGKGNVYEGAATILATGHSARGIYELFARKGWTLEAKPFALGVRVEHPQHLINSIQYHSEKYSNFLPPATYNLVTQVNGRGVFSFCMCPGGIIVPAATGEGQQVVNGMSNSRRNSPYANAGIAVQVSPADVPEYQRYGALALLRFQQDVEKNVFASAGNSINAPAQRMTDFCNGRRTKHLMKSSYMGTCVEAPLHEILPKFVAASLQQAFRDFGKKMHGYYTDNAMVLAVESRTSSPVRIPRGEDLQHVDLKQLYPCGEGAGYAGGIMSSALDGINCMNRIAETVK
jgi:hypothetical protein